MRLFQNLDEAAREIRRDLAKSPQVHTSRVQNLSIDATLHEAIGYNYTIAEMNVTASQLIDIGVRNGIWPDDEPLLKSLEEWLIAERNVRSEWVQGAVTEKDHPWLEAVAMEGNEPAYTYTDRLRGARTVVAEHLDAWPDSRRAFWPIYQPEDAVRMSRRTRIPCSIGYQLMIRDVADVPHLHMVYLQRSCDFKRFWLSDIWLARQFQHDVWTHMDMEPLQLGQTSHYIISLHNFEDAEVY